MGNSNFTVTFEENRGSILENIIKDTLNDYFRQHPTESITDEQLGAILGEYLTNHPIEGLTISDVNTAIADYLVSHPIEGVSTEEVNTAIASYLEAHPVEGASAEEVNSAIESYMQSNPIASGEDGKSAFQIAQDNGFNGTESEWIASLKGAKGDTGDSKIICPDDYGAVGNGVTIDDNAFLEGDYVYQLTEGKEYRVSSEKIKAIHNMPIVGKGKIVNKYPNLFDNTIYNNNYKILPTYGADVLEISEYKPKNRLEECVSYLSDIKSYNTVSMNRWRKRQGVKHPTDEKGSYLNIGAVYYDYDRVEDLPEQFTICIGRSAVFQKKANDKKWTKTVDKAVISSNSIYRYSVPWNGANARFAHEATEVDGHIEIVVEKEELTTWGDNSDTSIHSCAHFWSGSHLFNEDEFDDLINYWEVWVKEPEAIGILLFSSGVDVKSLANATNTYGNQAIISVQMPLTTEPQAFWNTTYDEVSARDINFEEVANELFTSRIADYSSNGGRNFNLLGFNDFSNIAVGDNKYLASQLEDGTLQFEKQATGTAYINLNEYLADTPIIKKGERFRINVEYLTNLVGSGYLGELFPYTNVSELTDATKKITLAKYGSFSNVKGQIYTGVFEALADFDRFIIFTNGNTWSDTMKLRIWITKGEEYREYQKYGADIDGYILSPQVVDKYLETKVDTLAEKTSEEMAEMSQIIASLQARLSALENPS